MGRREPTNARHAMNVSLTPELEAFVTKKVESGLYGSQSEVVREGLRLLMEQDRMTEARLEELRSEIAKGLEQARRGDLIPGEKVFARLRRKSRERRERGKWAGTPSRRMRRTTSTRSGSTSPRTT